jgi:hypothetical protein
MDKLEEFVGLIADFNKMKQSQMMDCFSYYFIGYLKREKFAIKDIHDCFVKLSIPPYSNVRQYLADNSEKPRGKGMQKFIKVRNDFTLTRQFIEQLENLIVTDKPKVEISNALRSLINKLPSESEKNYLEEAIKTFEVEAFRAAIIMVWLLTIDHLYEFILSDSNRITRFVTALRAANCKVSIHSKDDFGELKESIFLTACKSSGIISHDVWKILDVKLGIRNSFAHPSTVHLPKSKALEFIEDLITNVVLKYSM